MSPRVLVTWRDPLANKYRSAMVSKVECEGALISFRLDGRSKPPEIGTIVELGSEGQVSKGTVAQVKALKISGHVVYLDVNKQRRDNSTMSLEDLVDDTIDGLS